MQMGIERLLKEKFPNLGQVLQVQDGDDTNGAPSATELTWEAIQSEVNRIKPAITALGGVVEVVKVDPTFGAVDLKFRGSNRIRQGLEMAIRDVPFVKHVNFVMGDE
jgi:Fe-S cluster biogenesis protein NfuA